MKFEHKELKIFLIGNYLPDRQESMQGYASLLMEELPKHGIQTSYIAPKALFGKLKPSPHGFGKWLGYVDKYVLFPLVLKRKLRRLNKQGDWVVHVCDHSNSMYLPFIKHLPHTVTCHDLIAVKSAIDSGNNYRPRITGRIYQRLIRKNLEKASHVIAVSNATASDIKKFIPSLTEKVAVIPNGLRYPFRRLDPQSAVRKLVEMGLDPQAKYILSVGSNTWYKNRKGVLEIFSRVVSTAESNLKLIMVGAPPNAEMRKRISELQIADRIIELERVTDNDLCTLYNCAELLLFPSLQEGFGWPIIEAQACGCRVVTSNRNPMIEVGAEAAFYIDPNNPVEAARVVKNVLAQSVNEREKIVNAGLRNVARFSVDRMVESYIREYEMILCTSSKTD